MFDGLSLDPFALIDDGAGPTLSPPPDPEVVTALLADTGLPALVEVPLPRPPVCNDARILLRPADMLSAVVQAGQSQGFDIVELGDVMEGDAEFLADRHADLAARLKSEGRTPLILSGGEASVRVSGSGRGGRNGHFLLALALALERRGLNAHALAIDSDGIDGNSGVAGAPLQPDSLALGRAAGLDPAACLASADSLAFWTAVGGTVETGPTRSNRNDLRMLIPG